MSWRQPETATASRAMAMRQHLSMRVGPHPHALLRASRDGLRPCRPPLDDVGGQPGATLRTPNDRSPLLLNFIDLSWPEALEKLERGTAVELRILRLDREKEPFPAAAVAESLDVEDGVVRHRQPVQENPRAQRRVRGGENLKH